MDAYSLDDILTPIMIYWVTGCIASSIRLYYEALPFFKRAGDTVEEVAATPIRQPVGLANYPGEVYTEPIRWAKYSFKNIVHVTYPSKGGHFAAWEVPDLFVADIDTFASKSIGPFSKYVAKAQRQRPPKKKKGERRMIRFHALHDVCIHFEHCHFYCVKQIDINYFDLTQSDFYFKYHHSMNSRLCYPNLSYLQTSTATCVHIFLLSSDINNHLCHAVN